MSSYRFVWNVTVIMEASVLAAHFPRLPTKVEKQEDKWSSSANFLKTKLQKQTHSLELLQQQTKLLLLQLSLETELKTILHGSCFQFPFWFNKNRVEIRVLKQIIIAIQVYLKKKKNRKSRVNNINISWDGRITSKI